jgi:hypothetical protein
MILLFLFVLFLIGAVACFFVIKDKEVNVRGYDGVETRVKSMAPFRYGGVALCIALALFCMVSTSIFFIGGDGTGHLERVYGGSEMPQGQIIAAPWQKGPQAEIYGPGFHFIPFVKVFYDVEELSIVEVPEGKAGVLLAKDGLAMPADQAFAPLWEDNEKANMLNAMYFLGFDKGEDKYTPRGIKGPQATAIGPGKYRINRYLWTVKALDAVDVPKGHVAVVKANFGGKYTGEPIHPEGLKESALSVPIVPKGYQGVWNEVLEPTRYYLNTDAMNVFIIPTQVQNLAYLGGYTRRFIDLEISDKGEIVQSVREEQVPVVETAADKAILLRVENWDVFQDVRVQIQVKPENAPYLVASVGGLEAAENKIITPDLRSILRNEVAKQVEYTVIDPKTNKEITKHRPRQVMDLLYRRAEMEDATLEPLSVAANTVGIHVVGVRFGDPVVPPELLIPGKRKQLAEQLIATYKQEQAAQAQRVDTERKRAEADQQPTLMKSEIGIKVAENNATARRKEGLGEKAFLEAVAAGQMAQKRVLGDEKTFELAYLKEVMAAFIKVAETNPDAIKMPHILVNGEGGGLSGAAAILGASNVGFALDKTKPTGQGLKTK